MLVFTGSLNTFYQGGDQLIVFFYCADYFDFIFMVSAAMNHLRSSTGFTQFFKNHLHLMNKVIFRLCIALLKSSFVNR